MNARGKVWSVLCVTLLGVGMGLGCNGDSSGPGPGGSTISGNITTASTATADTSLTNIDVVAQGDGREASDLTGSNGSFTIADAPTGDVTVLFRRGGCEASVLLGNIISNSTITLQDTDFHCAGAGTGTGTVDATSILEDFTGVIRNDSDPESAVTLCIRTGSSNRDRDVDVTTSQLEDEGGQSTSFASFRNNDLVEVHGERAGTGDGFDFVTDLVQLKDRNVRDDCQSF